jgi:type IV pilus assembly protein PilN
MVRINLLPIRSILRNRELRAFGVMAGLALVVVIGLMAVTYFYFDMQISSLQSEQRRLQNTLSQLERENKKITELKGRIASLTQQVETIKKLTETRDTPAEFMAGISSAIPDEVWVNQVVKRGGAFDLTGSGVDNVVVVNFVERLQKVRKGFTPEEPFVDTTRREDDKPLFSGVKLHHVIRKGEGGLIDFRITGRVN